MARKAAVYIGFVSFSKEICIRDFDRFFTFCGRFLGSKFPFSLRTYFGPPHITFLLHFYFRFKLGKIKIPGMEPGNAEASQSLGPLGVRPLWTGRWSDWAHA